jgi:hypothetical protein
MQAYRWEILIGVLIVAATFLGYAIDPTVPVAVVAIAGLPYSIFLLSQDPKIRAGVKSDTD